MSNHAFALRGLERGPYKLMLTPMMLQCPHSFQFEVAYNPEINVYADVICIDYDCRACVAGGNPFPARHTAVLPKAAYVSPDALEVKP